MHTPVFPSILGLLSDVRNTIFADIPPLNTVIIKLDSCWVTSSYRLSNAVWAMPYMQHLKLGKKSLNFSMYGWKDTGSSDNSIAIVWYIKWFLVLKSHWRRKSEIKFPKLKSEKSEKNESPKLELMNLWTYLVKY